MSLDRSMMALIARVLPSPGPEPARLVSVAVEMTTAPVLVELGAGEAVGDIATPGGPQNLTVAPDGTAATTALYATTDLASRADGQAQFVTLATGPAGEQAWVTLTRRDDLAVVDSVSATVDRHVETGHVAHDRLYAPTAGYGHRLTRLLLVLDGDEVVHRRELGVEAHHLTFTPTAVRPGSPTTAPTSPSSSELAARR